MRSPSRTISISPTFPLEPSRVEKPETLTDISDDENKNKDTKDVDNHHYNDEGKKMTPDRSTVNLGGEEKSHTIPVSDPDPSKTSPVSALTKGKTTMTIKTIRKFDFGFLPIPKKLRHNPALTVVERFPWNWRLNVLFAITATVAVMNLYYIQPMLVAIADDFKVSYDAVSRIPTLAQGGYGCGIVFVSPLGDLVRRRQLVIVLFIITTGLSIGLALSKSVAMLEGLSFVVGLCTVSPQIMIPWTADMAPANKRARSMSITLSGLIFGLVLGRVLAGVLSTLKSWRDTYWLSVALQGVMCFVLYFSLPDTPDKNIGLSYFGVLWSMAKFLIKYPTLVQACLVAFFTSAVFAGFWTTLTFLLSDPPYNYSSLDIGLFGLLGIIGALLAPQWGRLVDRIVPWLGQLIGSITGIVAMVIALAAAEKTVGAVCVAIVVYDMGQQCLQVASSYRIAGLDPQARARLNGCFLLFLFAGQTSGTAIITNIYNSHGWRPAGGCAVAFGCAGLLLVLLRGPHEQKWIGWRGGSQVIKRDKMTDLSPEAITEGVLTKLGGVKDKLKGGDGGEEGPGSGIATSISDAAERGQAEARVKAGVEVGEDEKKNG